MFHVLYLQRAANLSYNLLMGNGDPNENEVHNLYKVVRKFKDGPPKEEVPVLLEKIYIEMQSEKWSPNGIQNTMLDDMGLSHASLSVGDMVFDDLHNDLWICRGTRFERVFIKDLDSGNPLSDHELRRLLPLDDVHDSVREVYIDEPPLSVMEQIMADAIAGDDEWIF